MNTLYELFHVKENATQDEIAQAYQNLLKEADSLPQSEQLMEQIRRVKIAYGILSNPEKRRKYDSDLATKRTNELLEKVQVKQEESEDRFMKDLLEERMKQTVSNQIEHMVETYRSQQKEEKTKQKIQEKRQKKQLQKQKKEARKQQQLKKEMEIQAYGRYLEKQGYQVKYPWTWMRIKRLLITVFGLIISLILLWQIPFVKNTCLNLYKENFVIKIFVDAIGWLIDTIKWW